jgi:putative flavoprotein involved in K+ transport
MDISETYCLTRTGRGRVWLDDCSSRSVVNRELEPSKRHSRASRGDGERELDVLVVGAGQAGLAAGYFLERARLTFLICERHPQVGDSWRRRFDSLCLFTPRWMNALPGVVLPGDQQECPGKDELAGYLESYARQLALPVATNEGIARLERAAGGFVARTSSGRDLRAAAVIVATGAFQESRRPPFAADLTHSVRQVTATEYRRPAAIADRPVLVVGAGATGRQIAHELAATHPVSLAVGGRFSITPQRLLGRNTMGIFASLGFLSADKASLIGRIVRARESFPGWHLRLPALRRRGVELLPRALGASGSSLLFGDGRPRAFATVIWTIGYHDDSSWLAIDDAVDSRGFRQERGVSPVPGLWHVGRSWQTCRSSALLYGVGRDAELIVNEVAAYVREREARRSP